jgi:hypothetical protein
MCRAVDVWSQSSRSGPTCVLTGVSSFLPLRVLGIETSPVGASVTGQVSFGLMRTRRVLDQHRQWNVLESSGYGFFDALVCVMTTPVTGMLQLVCIATFLQSRSQRCSNRHTD